MGLHLRKASQVLITCCHLWLYSSCPEHEEESWRRLGSGGEERVNEKRDMSGQGAL